MTAAGLVASACATTTDDTAASDSATAPQPSAPADGSEGGAPATEIVELPPPLVLDVPDPGSVYDPVRAGEAVPEGFRQVLGRDDIAPVYDPSFVTASAVSWPEDSLVIGVDLEGEARAYPVGFLNRREIVNDNHRGIPTLVTW